MRLLQTITAVASTSGRQFLSFQPASRGMAPTPAVSSRCWGGREAAGASRCAAQPPAAAPQGLSAAPAAGGQHHRRRRPLPPLRVTNERREIPASTEDDDYIIADPDNPIPNPQLGDLERRIGLPYEEALFADDVDAEAQAYWFTEPETGWNSEKKRLRKLPIVPDEEAEQDDEIRYWGDALKGRRALGDVREGEVLTGKVTANLYYHGAQIDIGAEYDALLPCTEEHWPEVGLLIAPGTEMQVRVHRVRDRALFRFPIQLSAVDPTIGEMLTPPDEHIPPMDLRVLRLSPQEIAERSEGLRQWKPAKKYLELEEQYRDRMGDAYFEDHGAVVSLDITPELQARMDAAVDRIVSGF